LTEDRRPSQQAQTTGKSNAQIGILLDAYLFYHVDNCVERGWFI
jgi:hypothetical protein